MNIDIKHPNESFNFNELSLGDPTPISNGFYYSQILCNSKDLYIQTPEITSKNGIVKSNNKQHIDLIFRNIHETILEWFENLENRMKVLIYNNRSEWFTESNVEMSDIENIFISPIRTYKSGKQFVVRTQLEAAKNNFINVNSVKIYDTHQNEINIESFSSDSNFISLLKIAGMKFSSRTFQIYIEMKQIMVVNNDTHDLKQMNSCLIEKPELVDAVTPIPILLQTEKSNESYNDVSNSESIEIPNEKESLQENEEINTQDDMKNNVEEGVEEEKGTQETIVASDEMVIQEANEVQEEANEVQEDNLNPNEANEVIETKSTEDSEGEEIVVNTGELEENVNDLEKNNQSINEVQVSLDTLEDSDIKLHNYNNEHIELYKSALKRAKDLRKQALESHLQAQNIKAKYLMNVYSDSDSDSDMESDNNIESDQEIEANI